MNLFVRQRFVQAGLFDVKDFTAQGQNCLEAAVAALLGGATGAVTLDDVEFALFRFAAGAVGQLAGEGQAFQRALAHDQVAGFARGFTGAEGHATLLDDLAGITRVLFQPFAHGIGDGRFHMVAHFVVEQLQFVLPFKLRVDDAHTDNGGHALARIITREVFFVALDKALFARIVIDQPRDSRAQPGEMGAAIGGVDGIGKGKDRIGITVGILQRHLDMALFDIDIGIDREV